MRFWKHVVALRQCATLGAKELRKNNFKGRTTFFIKKEREKEVRSKTWWKLVIGVSDSKTVSVSRRDFDVRQLVSIIRAELHKLEGGGLSAPASICDEEQNARARRKKRGQSKQRGENDSQTRNANVSPRHVRRGGRNLTPIPPEVEHGRNETEKDRDRSRRLFRRIRNELAMHVSQKWEKKLSRARAYIRRPYIEHTIRIR